MNLEKLFGEEMYRNADSSNLNQPLMIYDCDHYPNDISIISPRISGIKAQQN